MEVGGGQTCHKTRDFCDNMFVQANAERKQNDLNLQKDIISTKFGINKTHNLFIQKFIHSAKIPILKCYIKLYPYFTNSL